MLKQYYDYELRETTGVERSDKGQHRIDSYWQDYIQTVYEKSIKAKHPLSPADVVREVQRHAVIDLRHEEGDYPHPATIYRILNPLIEQQKRRKKARNPGSGSWLAVETRDGKLLRADFSNQIVQCDHTKLDIRIVDKDGNLLSWRPWLTTVVDTFSSCLIGYRLWHKQPGSHEVSLALRHAILPKQYLPDYQLENDWNIYGAPLQYFFTDGGKDLSRSKHIKTIGKKLGFQCELRDRPPQGGIVERLFKTINTQVLASLPGYQPPRAGEKDEAAQERAEKEASLTIEDLDKLLAIYFCDDYNHQPYPKDPRETRYQRWFKGMGNRLPEPVKERDLDICLMKEEQRIVQAHGSIYFENLTYRCEELRSRIGEYVMLRYDPEHILTLFIYGPSKGDELGEFIGHAHAINMDAQDLSLSELKQQNKERSNAKRQHSNYDALLALDKRNKLAEQRKQDKKERQRSEQKKWRRSKSQKTQQNSNVVEIRQKRGAKSANKSQPLELLPERITPEEIPSPKPASLPQTTQPTVAEAQPRERHRLVLSKDQKLKRIW